MRLLTLLLAIVCGWSATAAEESRNYPLGPIGGQYRISGGEAYARVVSLTSGAPGDVAGLQTGDFILGAFGKSFTPTGSYHYGVSQELGFAVDRAEGNGGQLPLQILRPGVGGLDLTVTLPADGSFGPAYPRNDAKSAELFESACAWLHSTAMSGNGNMGYFTGWTGLSLLGHPDWNATTGPRPYRLSINKIRDYIVAELNAATYSPVENLLIDGSENPNHDGQVTISNWQLGQKVMFLSEYYAKTADASVVAPLQRGTELCANTIQWWKQPAQHTNGFSPEYAKVAGMCSHGGVTGDYMHQGWYCGINITGCYSFNGMAFSRRAGMDMNVRPRDGHYFGYDLHQGDTIPASIANALPSSITLPQYGDDSVHGSTITDPFWYDMSVHQKFVMQLNFLARRSAWYSDGNNDDGKVGYAPESITSYDAGGRTPGTLLGMAMYLQDVGGMDAADLNRLESLKGYITRNYMRHQEAHAYSVGAQVYQAMCAPYLSDRQQRFFMENWRFYYALSQTHDGGFQYFRARTVNDNYLSETHCAALNAALPYAIANGGISLIPAYESDRLLARFDNPEITWPSIDARKVSLAGTGTLPMPLAIVDGDGTVLAPAEYSLSWSKISGPGTVTFNASDITFSESGDYRIQMTATRAAQSLVEPVDVSVRLFDPPAGYVGGKADYQVYTGISGNAVADLTNAAKYPDSPDVVRTVTRAAGDFSGDSYGARLSGAIIPPVTGSYRFYIAADDRARLTLNPNGMDSAAATIIASLDNYNNWTNPEQWDKYPTQESAAFNLTAGQALWFEALHKEGASLDHLSVGWSIDGGPIEVIEGSHLAALSPEVATMTIVSQPAPASAAPGETAVLSVATTGPAPALYQWRRNGNPIGSPNTENTLTLDNISGGAEGDYDVVYTTSLGTLTSDSAHITVTGTGETIAGGLWREVYTDISGNSVSDLTSNAKFPNFSDSSGPITSATSPSDYASTFGERWTGWITPAVTGNHRFYLASDDNSEVWLGTSELPASAVRILTLSGYTGEKQWSARSPSSYIFLTAGVRYYFEVLHKEGGGGDHCAVAWQLQGDSTPTNGSGEIPGSVLSYRNGGIYDDIPVANTAPEFSADPVIGVSAFDGTPYDGTLAGTADDSDSGDTLSYSLVSVPTWLVVATDGTLSGTPATANIGLNQFTVRVTDSGGLTDDATLEIQVAAANAPPAFTTDPLDFPAATALVPYTGHSLASSASDGDGDVMTFSLPGAPQWLSVAADGTLSGTPAIGDIGPNSFTIRVSDPAGGIDEAVLNIEVTEPYFLYDINGATAGSGANAGGSWDGSAQWTTDTDGTTDTIDWADGAIPVFSAGTDATGTHTVNNTTVRSINGFIARSGTPRVFGSALEVLATDSPFIVEATALGARIDATLSGTGGIVKSGPGTLVLGGDNTYLSDTTISSGVLELAAGAKLYNAAYNASAVITIGSGGTWRLPDYSYEGVGQLSDYRQRRVLDGGVIEVTGDTQSSGQDFTVNASGGTFRYTPAGQTLTLEGNTNTNIQATGALTFDTIGNVSVTGGSSILTGIGSVVKTGTGDLTLGNGGNSFIGSLSVTAGKLFATASSVGSNTAIGTKLGGRIVAVNAPGSMEWTINNILGGSGLAAVDIPTLSLNGGTLTSTRFNVLGNTDLNGGSLVNANATDPVNYDGFQFIGTISANGTAPSSITTTTAHGNHLLGGATTNFSVTDASGRLAISTVLRNGSSDYSGTASLEKSGPGTLALNAANVFTGTTTISSGTLELGGSLAGATTVSATGTLSGSGTVNATVTVQSGGTLAPGSDSTLSTGALTLDAGSTLLINPASGSHGSVSTTGNAVLTGATLDLSGTPDTDPFVVLNFTGTRSGEFDEGAGTLPAGWQLVYDDSALEVRLESIPAGYDTWIDAFSTGGQSGFTEDADNDAIPNALEFLLGGDPTVPNDTPAPALAPAPGGNFSYSFTRAARARGTIGLVAQLSDDLEAWPQIREITIGPDTGSSDPGVTITDQGDHDTIEVEFPGSPDKTFIRLKVIDQ